MNKTVATALKVVLTLGMIGGLGAVVVLWFLAAEMAQYAPEFAWLHWPMLALSISLIFCFEVILAAIWALLRLVESNTIFNTYSAKWVAIIIWAGTAATALLALLLIPVITVTDGPPGLTLMLVAGIVVGTGFVLLMAVMRQLLTQATTISTELDEVI